MSTQDRGNALTGYIVDTIMELPRAEAIALLKLYQGHVFALGAHEEHSISARIMFAIAVNETQQKLKDQYGIDTTNDGLKQYEEME